MTKSGLFTIDPDGVGIGELPFTVFCDMNSGSTIINHNIIGETRIPKCTGEDCFQLDINYQSTIHQISNLIDISSHCQQHIKFNCYSAPLFDDGINFGSWLNNKGEKEIYFHGSNSGNHICQCGTTNTCKVTGYKCNCDINDPVWDFDEGLITSKSDLPITGFSYFGLRVRNKTASVIIGPLECTGPPTYIPGRSCKDLKLQGETFSGYYQVSSGFKRGDGPIFKTVFCDFNQALDSSTIQRVELPLIKFEAVRDKSGDLGPGVVTYDWNSIPYGSSYINLSNGEFTVPITGTYKIFFQTLTEYHGSHHNIKFEVVGSRLLEQVWSDSGIHAGHENIHHEMIYKFVKGERIRVVLAAGSLVTRGNDFKIRFGGELLFL